MQFSFNLETLEKVVGCEGIRALEGAALQARLSELFAFLPEGTHFDIGADGVVRATVPPAPDDKKASAQRLAEKGTRSARKGDFTKAKKAYEQALDLDPSLISTRRDLAMLCSEMGRHEEAKDHLIDVLRLTPDDHWSYVVLANHYAKAKTTLRWPRPSSERRSRSTPPTLTRTTA